MWVQVVAACTIVTALCHTPLWPLSIDVAALTAIDAGGLSQAIDLVLHLGLLLLALRMPFKSREADVALTRITGCKRLLCLLGHRCYLT